LRGGYPEALARPGAAPLWFASYVQTYLERDVRAVTAVKDLAAPLGVSVPTITQWVAVLETTAQIPVVPPFYENFGKRLIKSPKVYLADSGLACHLLGIDTPAELAKSPFSGALFESFIGSEIVKAQVMDGGAKSITFATNKGWKWISSCQAAAERSRWLSARPGERSPPRWPRPCEGWPRR
jgi:predicted AAA+ superfamily ATPase